ncbi:uncharacterized protein [Antedon mediterranea]|uniref:uncharacterized protein isoform X2 n=1 Tax=Antedon mediterranea TaxID=105859 RepID=UPI003AF628ED
MMDKMSRTRFLGCYLHCYTIRDALKQTVASLPEREEAEEDLINELERQDAQTLAAKRISERPDILQQGEEYSIESDLLHSLRSSEQPEDASNLTSLMSGLKVQQNKNEAQKEVNVQEKNDGHFKKVFISQVDTDVADMKDYKTTSQNMPYKRQRKRSIFERYRLNIFEPLEKDKNVPTIDTKASIWEIEKQKELRMLTFYSIGNGFDEMTMLTEEGKLWQYPVNNEQGLEVEKDVGFHEHIFLGTHIASFPKKGAIRHFMELVIQGLSMNPYIAVQQKKDNINWFWNYFKSKESILKETGAIEKDFSFQ